MTVDKAVRFVLDCQDNDSGGFRYMRLPGPAAFARTASGLSTLQQASADKGDKGAAVEKGLKYLRSFKAGVKKAEGPERMHFFYGHYYAAQAMRRVGGKDWQDWYAAIRDELLRQAPEGFRQQNGSWSAGTICPHYDTAMALLILQTPGK
jgi:hypothetical protein